MISYLIRYNWAVTCGKIVPKDEYQGLAYNDMVIVALDETDEYVLSVSKEYGIPYEYVMDKMYYSDVTVLYAKKANENAFTRYNEYLNYDETTQGKYVADYGVPKPFVYSILTSEIQQENINKASSKLKEMYRNGGKFND